MKLLIFVFLIPFSIFSQNDIFVTTKDLKDNCCVRWHFNKGNIEIEISDEATDIGHLSRSYEFEEVEPTVIGEGDYRTSIYVMHEKGDSYSESFRIHITEKTGECRITYSPNYDDDGTTPVLEFSGRASD